MIPVLCQPVTVRGITMFIRKTVAKGQTYYQIVEGRREGEKVRQRVLCSLGQENDPKAILKHRTRLLAQHRRELAKLEHIYPAAEPIPALIAKRQAQLRASIAKLSRDIDALNRFLESKMVGTTNAK
jgi:hypothetical protein